MLRSLSLVTCLLLVLFVAPLCPADTTIVKAKQYLDVANGSYVSPAVIVIEDGIIQAVNPAELPESTRTIDLGDQTLLPGLIDMHTHLCYSLEGDWVHRGVKEGPADWASSARRTPELLCWPGSPPCETLARVVSLMLP